MNYPNWFKKTGYNNSLSQKNRDGGYNVKNLIAKHALATRYEFDQLFINDLIAIYELHGRDSVNVQCSIGNRFTFSRSTI